MDALTLITQIAAYPDGEYIVVFGGLNRPTRQYITKPCALKALALPGPRPDGCAASLLLTANEVRTVPKTQVPLVERHCLYCSRRIHTCIEVSQ